MIEDKYEIWDSDNNMLADNLRIDVAMIVVRALFENWYNETGLELKIRRKVECECKACNYDYDPNIATEPTILTDSTVKRG